MIINQIGWGSGGSSNKAYIVVNAPSSSKLDLYNGSVLLDSYTLSTTETSYTFNISSLGTYTVKGTLGSVTQNKDVEVAEYIVYTISLSDLNKLYLYKYGDECTSITGGWNTWWNYDSYGSVNKYSSYIQLYNRRTTGAGGRIYISTANKINTSSYSMVTISYTFTTSQSTGAEICYYTSTSGSNDNVNNLKTFQGQFTSITTQSEVLSTKPNLWLGVGIGSYTNGTSTLCLYELYLS